MGFIVKYNPNLIAGYIAGYYLLFYIGFTNIAEYIPLFTILTGVVFILVRAQRFDKSSN
jgi:hypothetical protein